MTKYEFTEGLRKALSGIVGHSVVNENVKYYEDYIDMEIRKGRKEEEVMEELGDPRLIAKTIIETTKAGAVSEEEREEKGGFSANGHRVFRIPGWLVMCIVILLLLLLFWVVGSVLSLVLPILIPALLVWYLVRIWRSRR